MKRKISCFLILVLVVFTALFAVACNVDETTTESSLQSENSESSLTSEPQQEIFEVLSATEKQVVIRVNKAEGEATLTDVMKALREEEKLAFTIAGGMVTEINGKSNTANDFWMLYTSDTEMSNTEWGTVQYDGKTYASAILGADSLPVVDGGLYIWEYQSF